LKQITTLMFAVTMCLSAATAQAKAPEPPPADDTQYESANFNQLSNGAFADDLDGKWVKVDVRFGSLNTTYSKLVPWATKKVAKKGLFFYVVDVGSEKLNTEIAPGVSIPAGYEGVYLDAADRSQAADLKPGQKITLFGKAQKFIIKMVPMMPAETHTILRVVKVQPATE
jgi:hypothetical protein